MKPRILVTGAGGFIGSYLCKYFLERGHTVFGWVHHLTPELSHALAGCSLTQIDMLCSPLPALRPGVDIVIHTATANEVVSRDVSKGLQLSAIGTRNLLEWAAANGTNQVILVSTFRVYGDVLHGAISEETPISPMNDYALNHLFAEQYVRMYSDLKGLRGAILRPANVFGSFVVPTIDRWSLVPACFCREVFANGKITLRSSGRQVRNFVSLDDLSMACEAICRHFPDKCEVFNVSSGMPRTIISVAETVRDICSLRFGRTPEIDVLSNEPTAGSFFSLSQAKLHRLGFSESKEHTLEVEIARFLEFLEQQPGSVNP